jgi:MFS family permease
MYGRDHSPDSIVGLNTYPTMVMTVGSLILLPVAFVIGRRPVFLGSVLICLICYITAGTAHTFSQHMISRIFVGLATGTTETLLPLIIADITYLDERGFYFGIYWSAQNCISSGILVGIPYLVASDGWRWFYWFFTIVMSGSLVLAFFFLPETRFTRLPMTLLGKTIHTDDFGHTHVMTNEEAQRRFGHIETDVAPPEPKRSFLQELKPWSKVSPNAFKVWTAAYVKIGKSCTSPAVIWALLLASITLGTGIAITLVYSVVLETEYRWSASSVGLVSPICVMSGRYANLSKVQCRKHSCGVLGDVILWLVW